MSSPLRGWGGWWGGVDELKQTCAAVTTVSRHVNILHSQLCRHGAGRGVFTHLVMEPPPPCSGVAYAAERRWSVLSDNLICADWWVGDPVPVSIGAAEAC